MRGRINDLTGKKFGRWKVVRLEPGAEDSNARWLCECRCGTKRVIRGDKLKSGSTRSCGCLRRDSAELGAGQRFGQLVVIKSAGVARLYDHVRRQYRCKCDCGRTATISGHDLRHGKRTTCGHTRGPSAMKRSRATKTTSARTVTRASSSRARA